MSRVVSTGLVALMLAAAAACADDAKAEREPTFIRLLDIDGQTQVQGRAGAYGMTARGMDAPLAVVDVPAGYENFGFFALIGGALESGEEPFYAVDYWTVYGVFKDPCAYGLEAAPEIGGTVQDLAAALGAQERSEVSEPVSVSLGDHDGLYLELRVPSGLDIETCDEPGRYFVWQGKPGDAHHQLNEAGALERIWILDVEGQRVVLTAISTPGVPEEKVEELEAIVESARFLSE